MGTVEQYEAIDLESGWIPKEEAQKLCEILGISLSEMILDLLDVAKRLASPDVSGFRVGAVVQGISGAIYFGANQEFAQSKLSQTIHAEQAAIVNAYEHRELGIQRLAVTAEPCGYCRQFLYELTDSDKLEILIRSDDGTQVLTLASLLPKAFGPSDLGVESALFGKQNHDLCVAECDCELTESALRAAKRSYAPYTKSYAGVAIRAQDGQIFSGSYIENAAFNPSISPLQAAIVNAAMSGKEIDDLAESILVQRTEAKIDHAFVSGLFWDSVGLTKCKTVECSLIE